MKLQTFPTFSQLGIDPSFGLNISFMGFSFQCFIVHGLAERHSAACMGGPRPAYALQGSNHYLSCPPSSLARLGSSLFLKEGGMTVYQRPPLSPLPAAGMAWSVGCILALVSQLV